MKLFRPTAVAAAAGSDLGEPLRAYWRGVRAVTAGVVILLALQVTLLTQFSYEKAYRTNAYLDPPNGQVRIAAPTNSRIVRIHAVEGKAVEVGAPLLELSSDRLGGDGVAFGQQQTNTLQLEETSLHREIEIVDGESRASAHRLLQNRQSLEQQQLRAKDEIAAANRLLMSLEAQYRVMSESAAAGVISRVSVDDKRNEVLAQQGRVASVAALLSRIGSEIDDVQAEIQLVSLRQSKRTLELSRELAKVSEKMTATSADSVQVLRASQNGVISLGLVTEGQSVLAGQTLVTITPVEATLAVRVLVPSRALASTTVGTTVGLSFDAYPRHIFGTFAATIVAVSSAPLPAAAPGYPGSNAAEPIFVATALIDAKQSATDGRVVELRAGMTATAFVPLEKRSLLSWLVDPLVRAIMRDG
jgi:multidrug efflux pump subunit AcrA (membrane-fusion protein)